MASAARLSLQKDSSQLAATAQKHNVTNIKPLTILQVVPTLQAGAADWGVVELARILSAAGHRPLVLSRGGRLESELAPFKGEFIRGDVDSKNPLVMVRNAIAIARLIRRERCQIVHAHGRAPAWSAYFAARWCGVPFLTSWYKGFREQNLLKGIYNSIMARGDRVIAASEQIADLILERYKLPSSRICVVPASVDLDRFDPGAMTPERIDSVRREFGVDPQSKIVLVTGRMLRRKGHHVAVNAAHRLKHMGLKNFTFVFIGEDQGRSRYTGELWDLVLSTNTADVVRLAGRVDDVPAAYAAAQLVVSASLQPEGLQRSILEAQAMTRPVIVSDLSAGPDIVLAPPLVPDDKITGVRFAAGDDAALASSVIRLLALSEEDRRLIGMRGRAWVIGHFNAPTVAELTLRAYADLAHSPKAV